MKRLIWSAARFTAGGRVQRLQKPSLRMAGATRTFLSATSVLCKDFPPHTVVGLPALSPTMEEGTVQSWTVEVGGEIEASDIVCQIETDKAAVDFEATDDGYMALHLVEPGHAPVRVGHPIMILVEDEEDVAAFADATAADFAVEEAPKEEEKPAASAPTPAAAPTVAAQPAAPAPTPAAPSRPAPAVSAAPARSDNAFANGLNKKQHEYVNKYGSTLLESINVNSE